MPRPALDDPTKPLTTSRIFCSTAGRVRTLATTMGVGMATVIERASEEGLSRLERKHGLGSKCKVRYKAESPTRTGPVG